MDPWTGATLWEISIVFPYHGTSHALSSAAQRTETAGSSAVTCEWRGNVGSDWTVSEMVREAQLIPEEWRIEDEHHWLIDHYCLLAAPCRLHLVHALETWNGPCGWRVHQELPWELSWRPQPAQRMVRVDLYRPDSQLDPPFYRISRIYRVPFKTRLCYVVCCAQIPFAQMAVMYVPPDGVLRLENIIDPNVEICHDCWILLMGLDPVSGQARLPPGVPNIPLRWWEAEPWPLPGDEHHCRAPLPVSAAGSSAGQCQ